MYKTSLCRIQELEEKFVQQVLSIVDERFGVGYLTVEDFLEYIEKDHLVCYLTVENDIIIGLSLLQMGESSMIFTKFHNQENWLKTHFQDVKKVAYRSLTVVKEGWENKGVASGLIDHGMQELHDQVDLMLSDVWKSDHIHIEGILLKRGYQKLKEISNYWSIDSIERNYKCQVCGAPPCECTGVIFAKRMHSNITQNQSIEWWEREGLNYENGELVFQNTSIVYFARNRITPFYLYDLARVGEKVDLLQAAANKYGVPLSVFYAMKANRHPKILNYLNNQKRIGVDVCSPRELQLALESDFTINNITYTGTSLSNRDIDVLSAYSDLHVNIDSLSALRRFGHKNRGRSIGLRINPSIGLGYNESLEYTNRVVKFGLYEEQLPEALMLIQKYQLSINTLHVHCGSGYLSDQLSKLKLILNKLEGLLPQFSSVKIINIGGGLGVKQSKGDQALDLNKWAQLIAEFSKRNSVEIYIEPGDFLVKDAGILITEVNTIEEKRGVCFVGLDLGMNVNNEYAYYNMNLEPVLLKKKTGNKKHYTLAGNINEPIDLFAENIEMNELKEGDLIAFLNTGGYGASSSSNHCMRGDFDEYII